MRIHPPNKLCLLHVPLRVEGPAAAVHKRVDAEALRRARLGALVHVAAARCALGAALGSLAHGAVFAAVIVAVGMGVVIVVVVVAGVGAGAGVGALVIVTVLVTVTVIVIVMMMMIVIVIVAVFVAVAVLLRRRLLRACGRHRPPVLPLNGQLGHHRVRLAAEHLQATRSRNTCESPQQA